MVTEAGFYNSIGQTLSPIGLDYHNGSFILGLLVIIFYAILLGSSVAVDYRAEPNEVTNL